jgi:hypothetical protein
MKKLKEIELIKKVYEDKGKPNNEVQAFALSCLIEYKKQLSICDVVSSFLNKESESLGVNVEDLYINLCEDELTLHKEDVNSYYFNLHIEKIIE